MADSEQHAVSSKTSFGSSVHPFQVSLPLQGLLLVAALLVYLSISAYHLHRASLTGDEPHYLLITHSLWHDHDTNLYNNYQNRDYANFFWYDLKPAWGDQVSDTEIYSYRHKGGFPYFLIPGYVLGGQFGAVFQMNVVTALLMIQVFLLAYELFYSIPAAFGAWLCCAFTIPGIVYMNQLYPEIPAALLTILAVRQIWKLSENRVGAGKAFWLHCLLFGLNLTVLLALKTRYLPIAGMLGLAWFVCLIRERLRGKQLLWGLVGLIVAGGLGFGILMLVDKVVFDGSFWERLRDIVYMRWFLSDHNPLFATLGLLFDQEYGLFTYTPLYIMTFLGIGMLTRKEFRATWPLLGVVAVNYLVIAMWPLWHAAPTPPSRYILPILPVLGAFAARFFLSPCLTIQTLILGVGGIWSAIMAWFLTLAPGFRYNWADGTSHFLETASLRVGVNLTKLFPSWIRPSPFSPYITCLSLIVLGLLIFFCRRKNSRCSLRSQDGIWELSSIVLVLSIFLGLVFVSIAVGKNIPTHVLEMEDALDVRPNGGEREPETLDPWQNQLYLRDKKYYGWKISPGDSLRMRPTLVRGDRSLIIYARAILQDEIRVPRMQLFLENTEVAETTVASTEWKEYVFTIEIAESRPLLEIVCAPELNEEHAIVIDKIRFR